MNVRRMLFVSGFGLLLVALATSVAFAVGPVRQFLTVTNAACNLSGHSIGGTFTQQIDTPATELINLRINGAVVASGSSLKNPGSNGGGWGFSFGLAQSGDYDVQWEWIYTVNGQSIWRNTAGFRCARSVPTGIYATNEDLSLSAGCTLAAPVGSVVGEAPLGAQAYYEPGNIAPGVILNPGTYIVIGQDESETYYKIVLACQYLWVRKDTMQPSYLPPQNGTPLPITNVS